MQKSTKEYWAQLKNSRNNRKIRVNPQLFHNRKCFSDFKEKAELFNFFFGNQPKITANSLRDINS